MEIGACLNILQHWWTMVDNVERTSTQFDFCWPTCLDTNTPMLFNKSRIVWTGNKDQYCLRKYVEIGRRNSFAFENASNHIRQRPLRNERIIWLSIQVSYGWSRIGCGHDWRNVPTKCTFFNFKDSITVIIIFQLFSVLQIIFVHHRWHIPSLSGRQTHTSSFICVWHLKWVGKSVCNFTPRLPFPLHALTMTS